MGQVTQRALSIEEAADSLNISRAHLYKLLASGELPSLKLGSRRLILPSDLDAFLLAQRDAQTGAEGR